MLRINFTSDALAQLEDLPAKHARQIASKIMQCAQNPSSLPMKEMKGNEGFFRLKSGEYRIICRIDGEELKIWLIGKRNDDAVYKRFERKR
jgi:mRNA interferase RelE/StbE